MSQKSWDKFFMEQAFFVATKSKDKSTKVGSVVVGPGNEVVTMGFNGLPRGMKECPEYQKRPLKYWLTVHSERNSIYNAARIGAKLLGTRIYTQYCPCAECAQGVIQSGIQEIIVCDKWDGVIDKIPKELDSKDSVDRWRESCTIARMMFKKCGVKYRVYKGPINPVIKSLCSGYEVKLD